METIRLLLIEDNPGDADLVCEHLSEAHDIMFEVEIAGRLAHGLTLLQEHVYDVVVLDLTLPDSAGLATFARVREHTKTPVVILSGTRDESMALEALQRGAQDYLVKGQVDAAVIIRVLQYALARHRLDAMKSDFISMVNHELRTPFTSVHLALQLLHRHAAVKANPDLNKLVSTACTNSIYMLNLVNNILDFERLEQSGTPDTLETVDLLETARKAIAGTAVMAEQSGITCTLASSLSAAAVAATPDGLLQVMTNLLSNAIKHSPDNGEVTVMVTAIHGIYRVSVTDRGPGVPSAIADKLFTRFVRGKAVRKNHKGTGLGLAICKRLVEGFGGTIDYVSEPHEATTFFFDLPAADTNSRPQQETGSAKRSHRV